jgi:peptidoglycan/LPS O-acetylase OafA/YrhL
VSSPGTGWLPALDGVRALAVLAVVAFHVDPALVPSGSLGVEHARTGTVPLRGFYARRLRRLMPALVLLVLAQTVVLGVHGRLSGAYAADAARALSYTDDLFLGYGGTRGPFALTRSLSIEEQFYLLWPAVLLALLARLRRSGRPGGRPLVPALARLVALAVAVHLLVAATVPAGWVPNFLPSSRLDALLAGALLAAGTRTAQQRQRVSAYLPAPVAALALAGLGVCVLLPASWFRGWGLLVSVLQLLSAAPAGAGGVDVGAAAGRQTGCRHGGLAARGRPGLSLGRAAIPATARLSPRVGPSRP